MALNELRISGPLQASIVALVVGFLLRDVAAPAPAVWWPYALFAYAFVAAVLPWLLGGYTLQEELRPSLSLVLGVLFALPFWLAAGWLADSPYRVIVAGCRVMVALWGIHLLLPLGLWLRDRRRGGPGAP